MLKHWTEGIPVRLYEIVYVFDGDRSEDDINQKLDRFHELVTKNGGSVEAVDHWGVRQLAYTIRNHTRGYYVVAHVRADAEALPEFERIVKLDPEVIRYLVVINEGEPTTGLSVVVDRPARASDPAPEAEAEGNGEADAETTEEESDDDSPPEFTGGRGRRRRIDGPAIELLNYKDVSTLSRFMTEQGKILPKRTTRVTAGFQRKLGKAVKRARYLALIPYVSEQRA